MPLPNLFPTIYLITAILLSFIFHNIPGMSKFSLQLIALLTLFSFFHSLYYRRKAQKKSVIKYLNISNSLILTVITILLVLETGSLSSPLFFLLDIILFALSLFLTPLSGITASLALVILFLLNQAISTNQELTNLISLLLMAPIAQVFSAQYLRLLDARNQIKILKQQSDQLESNIETEETTTLLWLSLDFYNKMQQALDLLSQVSSNLSSLPYYQQQKLKTLYQDLKELFKSGQELKQKVDKLTDDEN